jgi:hypothetical protein
VTLYICIAWRWLCERRHICVFLSEVKLSWLEYWNEFFFYCVVGYIVKEFIDAENRMHPLCNFNSWRAKSRINKWIQRLKYWIATVTYFNKMCLVTNSYSKLCREKSKRICIERYSLFYKPFYQRFYNKHNIFKYGSIIVTIPYFMTLNIVSPDDFSVRDEIYYVALP